MACSKLGSFLFIRAGAPRVAGFGLLPFKTTAKIEYFPASENTRRTLIKCPLDFSHFRFCIQKRLRASLIDFLLVGVDNALVAKWI